MKKEITVEDVEYCAPCVYSTNFIDLGPRGCFHLCNFILIAERQRGCPWGTGCTARIIGPRIAPANAFRKEETIDV